MASDKKDTTISRRDLFRGAVQSFRRIRGDEPRVDHRALDETLDHGDRSLSDGHFSVAGDYYRSVLSIDPSRIEARIKRAYCLLRMGKLVQARVELARCVKDRPDMPMARLLLGLAQSLTGQKSKVMRTWQDLSLDDPETDTLITDCLSGATPLPEDSASSPADSIAETFMSRAMHMLISRA